MSAPAIELRGATRRYPLPADDDARGAPPGVAPPPRHVDALAGVDLQIAAGELCAIVGRSGSGKSTLLNLIAGIDRPTAGEVRVAGCALHALGESALSAWRGRNVGIVFQSFQLLPTLTVLENAMLPMDFCGTYPPAQAQIGRAHV
jgi:putative ABC transport system ATP-binding protein